MNIEELKESIKDKELRLSQLRIMDTNKLRSDDRDLIKDLESEITELKERQEGKRLSVILSTLVSTLYREV